MIVLIARWSSRRRPGRDRAAVLPEVDDRAGRRASSPTRRCSSTGRDIYMREGCYNCHSQMIRPLRAETERYGHYSVAGEFVYDHPFQWGSQAHRPGPAPRRRPLQRRVAPRAPDATRATSCRNRTCRRTRGSPSAEDRRGRDAAKMRALRRVGVPYTDEEIARAAEAVKGKTEMDALIAYLQGSGTAIKTVR